MNGLNRLKRNKKFIYLISPNKIPNKKFYIDLDLIFKTEKISFFQLRLKKINPKKIIYIGKKIKKICRKYKVKFIINDSPRLAKKIGSHGCHLGQSDPSIPEARKILKKKSLAQHVITQKNLLKRQLKKK